MATSFPPVGKGSSSKVLAEPFLLPFLCWSPYLKWGPPCQNLSLLPPPASFFLQQGMSPTTEVVGHYTTKNSNVDRRVWFRQVETYWVCTRIHTLTLQVCVLYSPELCLTVYTAI